MKSDPASATATATIPVPASAVPHSGLLTSVRALTGLDLDPLATDGGGVVQVPVEASCWPVDTIRALVCFLTALGECSKAGQPTLYGLKLRVPFPACGSASDTPQESVARLLAAAGLPPWAVTFASQHMSPAVLPTLLEAAIFFQVPVLEYLCAAVAAAVWCVLDARDVRLPFMSDDASAGLFDLVQDRELVDQNPWAWYGPRQVAGLVLPTAPPGL